jgi:WD40 repeat protein
MDSLEVTPGRITPKVAVLLHTSYERADYKKGWNIACFSIPQIQASYASEVKTIVCINEERSVVGTYYNGSVGYKLNWNVHILTWPEGRLIFKGSMSGNDPPFILYRATGSSPVYGSEPRGDFFKTIREITDTPVPVFADVGDAGIVTFSTDGKFLTSASEDRNKTIVLWDVATLKEVRTLTALESTIYRMTFSPDGKLLLAFWSLADTIRLWDVATWKEVRTLTAHKNTIDGITFSPNGKLLTLGMSVDTIKLWDIATGKEVRTLQAWAHSWAFSPDGKLLASGDAYYGIKLWDVTTGKEIRMIKVQGYNQRYAINSITFSPDGKLLALGGEDGAIRLCDVTTGKELWQLVETSSSVKSVAFSPNGKLLASGRGDATIRLIDVATRKEVRVLKWHTDSVNSVAFSPDGKLLASGSSEGTIRLWDLASQEH